MKDVYTLITSSYLIAKDERAFERDRKSRRISFPKREFKRIFPIKTYEPAEDGHYHFKGYGNFKLKNA